MQEGCAKAIQKQRQYQILSWFVVLENTGKIKDAGEWPVQTAADLKPLSTSKSGIIDLAIPWPITQGLFVSGKKKCSIPSAKWVPKEREVGRSNCTISTLFIDTMKIMWKESTPVTTYVEAMLLADALLFLLVLVEACLWTAMY